ncbi:MAG TPA: FAD-dependent oxidoreductase [Ktedonobacterales bacterium]|nr:FAD-dependent oxidoreductase [Ktedonobacterales bacterium]
MATDGIESWPTYGRATHDYDTVIVGAGVSGLLAAHELLRRRPGTRTLVVDAGLPLEQRLAQATPPMGGYGGAGLYLGGRLYLGAASLPVMPPVTSPDELRPVISGDAYVRRANEVDALLHELGAQAEWQQRPPEPLEQAIAHARVAGLDYITSYPSRRLSPEDKRVSLAALRQRLEASGAQFLFQAQVSEITRLEDDFALTLRAVTQTDHPTAGAMPRGLRTRTLLLAPGRYGAEWLKSVTEALGAKVVAAPSTFGVRLEIPAQVYDPLTDVNPDPRLQMMTDGDALIKTYATCPGGFVAPVTRYGALVASGVPVMKREDRGPSTTIAILAQPGVRGAQGEWQGGEDCARLLNQRAPGRLIVQRLGDVRRREATTAEALSANSVRPSDSTAIAGTLFDAYPQVYWRAFDVFLERVNRLAPGALSDDALVYGPAEERFWGFPTDELLQTTAPGLFVAGDGAGQSQGIIQASVAGLLAGEGMARALDVRRARASR